MVMTDSTLRPTSRKEILNVVNSPPKYTTVICVASAIVIIGIIIHYFASYTPQWDWAKERLNADCTATIANQYGIPETMICPRGMVEKNITNTVSR